VLFSTTKNFFSLIYTTQHRTNTVLSADQCAALTTQSHSEETMMTSVVVQTSTRLHIHGCVK